MRVRELIWLPIRVVWAVVKACAIPAAVTALAWWLLPDSWAKWATIAMLVWAAIVVVLIAAKVSGHLRSLQRGPFYIRSLDNDWM
nr:hypothetical protein [Kibdelosporangium sp. MJ126-NF4]CTQ91321.1 hypothetical protein [Kibdelosporangium sp. MJ126-NF4]